MELKFLKGENLSYLGPNSDGDAVLFNLRSPAKEFGSEQAETEVLASFEKIMHGLSARPHWGKLHAPPSVEYMRATYPGWTEFEAVRKRFDPSETFSIFSNEQRPERSSAPFA
jgi:hypothetical protein